MTFAITTTGIDRLLADPLPDGSGWTVTFRSANAGMHHQLYVNGTLADWTDTVEQRFFLLGQSASPRRLAVVAVETAGHTFDLSDLLPAEERTVPWTTRFTVVRSSDHCPETQVAIFGDRGTGEFDTAPLLARRITPSWAGGWGFGEDSFGRAALGFDATVAPGAGVGAFGAGRFGIDADAMDILVSLGESGTHQVQARVIAPDGQVREETVRLVASYPPPLPPESIEAVSYDAETGVLTLQIQ